MNYSDKFGATSFQEISSSPTKGGYTFSIPEGADKTVSGSVTIADTDLLFSGDYARAGLDLIISKDDRKVVVPDYFKTESRATLSSRDGATLSAQVVEALTGHTAYAQAAGSPEPPKEIGTVAKLTGTATAIRNGVSVQLNAGDKVYKGDVLQSGGDSSLAVTFVDGTVFSLSSNARMVLNEMVYDPNGSSNSSLLSLVQGTITFVAGQTAKNGNMRVDTPVATMGIRGTAVLVEISANNGPTKFSVLVEPGNKVGSFVLYNKTTGQPIGTVSQAGQVTLVDSAGRAIETAKLPADLAAEKQLIEQAFKIYFPNYNDANPQGTKPAGSSVNNLAGVLNGAGVTEQRQVLFSVPVALPGSSGPATLTATALGNVPVLTVNDVIDIQAPEQKGGSFNIADQVGPKDPNVIPYIAGTLKLDKAEGPSSIPPGFSLSSIVKYDPATGSVSYNPEDFRFLADGEHAIYTFSFQSQSAEFIFTKTLILTLDGLNDTPTFTTSDFGSLMTEPVGTGSDAPFSEQTLLFFNDADFSDVASGYKVETVSVATAGRNISAPSQSDLLGYLHFDGLTKDIGTTQGVIKETFSAPAKAFDYLAKGESIDIAYTIRVTDADGASRTAVLTVKVSGTNDAPTITGATTPALTSGDVAEDGVLTAGGVITFSDVDLSDSHTLSQALTGGTISAPLPGFNPATSMLGSLHLTLNENTTDNVNTGTVAWSYTLDNLLAQMLGEGQTVVQTYTVTITDINGASTQQEVTVTIVGTNDVPTIVTAPVTISNVDYQTVTSGAVTEDANTGNLSSQGVVVFRDVDLTDTHTATFVLKSSDANDDLPGFHEGAGPNADSLGVFTLNNSLIGSPTDIIDLGVVGWTFTLNNNDPRLQSLAAGQTITQIYTITIVDSQGVSVERDITIVITGANDDPNNNAPVIVVEQTDAAGAVTEDQNAQTLSDMGTITFQDIDLIDAHTIPGSPLRPSGVTVTTTAGASLPLPGFNTATDYVGTLTLALHENTTDTSNIGTIDWAFSVSDSDARVQALAKGQVITQTYTVTIDDGRNGVATQLLTVTITGTNDGPIVATTDVTGVATELATTPLGDLTDSGAIAFTDIDLIDTHSIDPLIVASAGALGTLTASVTTDTTGTGLGGIITWNYSVPASAVEYLAKDEPKVETFTITLNDGNGGTVARTIMVTITGTNDAPVIDAITQTDLTEDQAGVPGSTALPVATFTDVDLIDVGHTAAISAVVASGAINGLALTTQQMIDLIDITFVTKQSGSAIGSVTLGFSSNDVPGAFDYLAANEVLTLTYTLQVDDHDTGVATKNFVVTVTGSNDAPVLSVGAFTDLTGIDEDQTTNAGQTVASFAAAGITDADHNAVKGIAITGLTSSNGVWQFSIDGGTTWTGFGAYDQSHALLLAADDKVRFVPNAENGGTDTFTYVAWDQTAGTHGNLGDATVGGNATAFSSQSGTARIEVTSVNDAPVITANGTTTVSFTENGAPLSLLPLATISDVDAFTHYSGASLNVALTNTSPGDFLTMNNSIPGNPHTSGSDLIVNDIVVGSVSGLNTTNVSFVFNTAATLSDVQTVMQSVVFFTLSDNPGANLRTATFTLNDGGNAGSGGALSAVQTVAIDVIPVNDAPVITSNGAGAAAPPISFAENSTAAVTTVTATDVDSPAASIVYQIVNGTGSPDAALFSLDPQTGVLSFIAAPDFENPADADHDNSYVVQVRAFDGTDEDIQTITVNVTNVQEQSAIADTITATEDTATSGLGALLKANDINGATATIVSVGTDQHGTSSLNGGNPIFTPDANFSGQASFEYGLQDGATYSVGVVTVDVAPVADAPIFGFGNVTPITNDFRVNGTTANDQTYSAVGALNDGGYVIAWVSSGQDGSGTGIYAHRFDASGNTASGELLVNASTTGDQSSPFVVGLANGGFLITYTDGHDNAASVRARYYDASGVAGPDFLVSAGAENASATVLSDGRIAITYIAADASLSGQYVRIYNSDASSALTGPILANTTTADRQQSGYIAATSDGGFIVTWHSYNQDAPNSWGAYFQRFDSAGNKAGVETRINDVAAGDQFTGNPVVLSDGTFVISWVESSTQATKIQHYSSAGVTIDAPVTIANAVTHTLTALKDGGFYITYLAMDGAGSQGLFGQRLGANGDLIGSPIQINQAAAGDQLFLQDRSHPTAVLSSGQIVSTWYGAPNVGGTEIYARHFMLPGMGKEDTAISLGANIAALTDTDGSESLVLKLSGFPAGATFSAGSLATTGPDTGKWIITGAALAALGNAQLTVTPPQNYNGSFTLHVDAVVTDSAVLSTGAASDTKTFVKDFAVTVSPVNDAPAVSSAATAQGNEDSPIVFSSASGNAITVSDIDGDNLSITLTAANGALTLASTAGLTFDGNGTALVHLSGSQAALNTALNGLTYNPAANYYGGDQLNVSVSDGIATASKSISLTVVSVNDPPTLDLDSNNSTAPGTGYATTFTVGEVPVHISDVDVGVSNFDGPAIQKITITITNTSPGDYLAVGELPPGVVIDNDLTTATNVVLTGTIVDYDQAIRAVVFATNSTNSTDRDVTVVVNDGVDSNVAHATIAVVQPANQPPVANDSAESIDEDSIISGAVDASDPEGGALTYVLDQDVAKGTLIAFAPDDPNGPGRFSFDPRGAFDNLAAGATEDVTFKYHVVDDHGVVSATKTVTITVEGVNDAPIIDLDGAPSSAGYGYSANLLADGNQFPIAAEPIVSDPDGTTIIGATVVLTNGRPGDFYFVPGADFVADPSGATGTIVTADGTTLNWTRSGVPDTADQPGNPLTITFTGTGTHADYADAIQQISFGTTSATNGERLIHVQLNDGQDAGSISVARITVSQPPTEFFTGPDGGSWSDDGNWSLLRAPIDNEHVTISGGLAAVAGDDVNIIGNEIFVDGTGSLLQFAGATLNDARLIGNDGGAFEVLAGAFPSTQFIGNSVDAPFFISGIVTINQGASLTLSGYIQNAGTIVVDPLIQTTNLLIDGNATISGSGNIVLEDELASIITSINAGATPALLTLVDGRISGTGQLGNGLLSIVIEENAEVAANLSGRKIWIDTGSAGTLTNHGHIVSNGSGGVDIAGNIALDGALQADAGVLEVHGDVTPVGFSFGSGLISGGTLKLDGDVAIVVTFGNDPTDGLDRDGTLVLNGYEAFSGYVSGMTFGDRIVFTGLSTLQVGYEPGDPNIRYGYDGLNQSVLLQGDIDDFIQIVAVGNDTAVVFDHAAVVDLDSSTAPGVGTSYSSSVINDGEFASAIGFGPTVTDADGTNLYGARIALTDGVAGDYFYVPGETAPGSNTGMFASGISWTISGTAGDSLDPLKIMFAGLNPAGDYADAIAQVSFGSSGGEAGTRHIEVSVNDGIVDSEIAIADIEVLDADGGGDNNPPTAVDDQIYIFGRSNLAAQSSSIVGNDSDTDGDSFTITSAAHGTDTPQMPDGDGIIKLAGTFGTLNLFSQNAPAGYPPLVAGDYFFVLGQHPDGSPIANNPIDRLHPGEGLLFDTFTYTIADSYGAESSPPAPITVIYNIDPIDMNVHADDGYNTGSLWSDLHNGFLTEIDSTHLRIEVREDGLEAGDVVKVLVVDAINLTWTGPLDDVVLTGGDISAIHVFGADGVTPLLDVTNVNVRAAGAPPDQPYLIGFYDAVGPNGTQAIFDALLGPRSFDVHGSEGADNLYGGYFNDRVDTGGSPEGVPGDTVYAGPGNDLIIVHDDNQWFVDGGDGIDILRFAGSFTTGVNSPGSSGANLEILDLNKEGDADGGAVSILIDGEGASTINELGPNNTGIIRVLGDSADTVRFDDSILDHPNGHWIAGDVHAEYTDDYFTTGVYFNKYFYMDGTDTLATAYVEEGVNVSGSFVPFSLSGDGVSVEESDNNDGITTVYDVKLLNNDPEGALTVKATADHGSVSATILQQTVSLTDGVTASASLINAVFADGVTYTPTDYDPNNLNEVTNTVTLTVTDSHGLRDSLHFVFQQSGEAGATLIGTEGKDIIFSTGHNDILTGSAGRDNFVFAPGNGFDQINDFTFGEDRIDLRQFSGVNSANIEDWLHGTNGYTAHASVSPNNGDDTLIDLEGGNTLLLKNVAAVNLHANDFILHPGFGA